MIWFCKNPARAAFLGLLAAAAIGLSGCSTSGVVAGGSDYSDSYLIADDSSLASQISVANVNHEMVGDLMKATATIQSSRDRSLMLQYKFAWYDKGGVEIDPGSKPYRDLTIEGKDTVSITSMAPNPDAREFKIRVKKIKLFKIENVR